MPCHSCDVLEPIAYYDKKLPAAEMVLPSTSTTILPSTMIVSWLKFTTESDIRCRTSDSVLQYRYRKGAASYTAISRTCNLVS